MPVRYQAALRPEAADYISLAAQDLDDALDFLAHDGGQGGT